MNTLTYGSEVCAQGGSLNLTPSRRTVLSRKKYVIIHSDSLPKTYLLENILHQTPPSMQKENTGLALYFLLIPELESGSVFKRGVTSLSASISSKRRIIILHSLKQKSSLRPYVRAMNSQKQVSRDSSLALFYFRSSYHSHPTIHAKLHRSRTP